MMGHYLRILTEVFTSSIATQYKLSSKCKVEWKSFEIRKVSENFLPVHPFPWSDWRRCFVHKERVNTEQSEQVPGGSLGRMEFIDNLTGLPVWKIELRDISHSYWKG